VGERERRPHAVPDQRDLVRSGVRLGRLAGGGHEVEHVVVERDQGVRRLRLTEVDQIDREALLQQELRHAPPREQIEDERLDHQRRDQEHRNRVARPGRCVSESVPPHHELALAQDLVVGRAADLVGRVAQHPLDAVHEAQQRAPRLAGDPAAGPLPLDLGHGPSLRAARLDRKPD
jgi:hypothetical protein